jgi:hypothetical protein
MSDEQNSPTTPPITKPPAGSRSAAATAPATAPAAPAPAGVSRAALIWIGVAVVVLSFVASFLGATLARSNDTPEAVPAPTTSTAEPSTEDYEAALEEILPAGAAVRAGVGAPEAGQGYEGEVYIDLSTSDVYLFKDEAWVPVGNIRASAAENLTGETGAAGAAGDTGATGETGATGAPGTPGTQILLETKAPDPESCQADGDIYINIAAEPVEFYECSDSAWTLVWPTPASNAPAPTPTTDSNG